MRFAVILLTVTCLSLTSEPCLANSGIVSKWDKKDKDAEFVSPQNINDIERCMLDAASISGPAYVYSQPDRPKSRMMLWDNIDANSVARLDLEEVENGTKVTSWQTRDEDPDQFGKCIPGFTGKPMKALQKR